MEMVFDKEQADYAAVLDENKKEIRKMVMDSYEDMLGGKGKDYKTFFTELERRYKNADV